VWVDYKIASNLILAQMWKDLFESEGLPTRLMPEIGINEWNFMTSFRILVPKGREHVADEILRKI
tara:strand:+ start:39712 stop:39906 length:195 start_codon:yes stop_codon:yes gene_type:complete